MKAYHNQETSFIYRKISKNFTKAPAHTQIYMCVNTHTYNTHTKTHACTSTISIHLPK